MIWRICEIVNHLLNNGMCYIVISQIILRYVFSPVYFTACRLFLADVDLILFEAFKLS